MYNQKKYTPIEIDDYIDKLMTSVPDKPRWNVEKILQGKPAHWNYIDGCMINSLYELYKTITCAATKIGTGKGL